MILLDTNILSELMRPAPEAAIERWLTEQPIASVFICAITEAELRYGLALMPSSKRRSRFAIEIGEMLEVDLQGSHPAL
jgi:toxin FitB